MVPGICDSVSRPLKSSSSPILSSKPPNFALSLPSSLNAHVIQRWNYHFELSFRHPLTIRGPANKLRKRRGASKTRCAAFSSPAQLDVYTLRLPAIYQDVGIPPKYDISLFISFILPLRKPKIRIFSLLPS